MGLSGTTWDTNTLLTWANMNHMGHYAPIWDTKPAGRHLHCTLTCLETPLKSLPLTGRWLFGGLQRMCQAKCLSAVEYVSADRSPNCLFGAEQP